jgi:uncharacterized protein YkwD
VPGTLSSPQYADGSAQLASFNLLNQYRGQCGFPALQQNTVLDQAAQAHAKYMGLHDATSDTEAPGSAGFTGADYVDRSVAAGFPNTLNTAGVSGGNSTLSRYFSSSEAGKSLIYGWLSGAYHVGPIFSPIPTIGIGEYETNVTDSNGYAWTQAWGTLTLSNPQSQTMSNTPLTFPCAGVTGVPYKSMGNEVPLPPNVSTSGWGTPVLVMGNSLDTIALQSASMIGPSGSVALQILNSTTDPNKALGAYQAVVYPTSPLQPNTQYSVTLGGTANGTPFSRNFTFTTGNVVG